MTDVLNYRLTSFLHHRFSMTSISLEPHFTQTAQFELKKKKEERNQQTVPFPGNDEDILNLFSV